MDFGRRRARRCIWRRFMKHIHTRIAAGAALLAIGAAAGMIAADQLRPPGSPDRAAAATAHEPGDAKKGKRRILHYRNPMGHPDTSPVPKKDSMGMDYIPVYEDEDGDDAAVKVSADRIQKLGVRTERAAMRVLARTIRATATVQIDEARQAAVTARFDGWIEKLMVPRTGDPVKKGQVLAEFYSPELVKTQLEHFISRRVDRRGNNAMAEGPLYRLRNFGIAEQDIAQILRTNETTRTLPLRAPMDGVVLEKKAVEGMRAAPGEPLFRIVDLSTVWMLAEVFEHDLGEIAVGQDVRAALLAFPGRRFAGKVAFVYPTMTAATRTARVRIELPNPDGALLPDMYGRVEIAARDAAPSLAVPDSAVIDSGTRRVVLVDKGEGRFEPREIETGRRGDGYVAVVEGLAEGEKVVVASNFLIDAESNLRSALRGLVKDGPSTRAEKKP
jgi:Cu(I)/Ag(I) efflux system membrane fusion protein